MTFSAYPEHAQTLEKYQHWLFTQPISQNTRRTYTTRVHQFCTFLYEGTSAHYGDPLREENARDFAVRDFKTHLLTSKKFSPASVNLSLAALDQFFRFLGLSPARCSREETAQLAPHALSPSEQKHLLRVLKVSASPRDRAIVLLLLYTGIRIGECVALNLEDISLSMRLPQLKIRSGKGNSYREIPIGGQLREVLQEWLHVRNKQIKGDEVKALFLNKKGTRMTDRAVDLRLRKLAAQAELTFSAHTLRHTCLTNLVRGGNDIVLVAEIAGHKRLETTRRYSLPSKQEKAAALASLEVEI